ncbi:MAG: ribbon-helix-helix domain-containing protein [Cyanobacteria bacterium P01_D01_bin.156]
MADDLVFTDKPYVLSVGEPSKSKTTISLPTPMLDKLKEEAAEKGVSVSELVRRSLELSNYLQSALDNGGNVYVQQEEGGPVAILEIQEENN